MTCSRPSRRAKGGFTILEAVIAAAILAGMMGFIYSTMMSMHYSIAASGNHLEAQGLAFDEAWEVFNYMYFEDLQSYPSPNTRPVPTDSRLYNLGGTMRTSVLESPDSAYCDIVVRIDWIQRWPGGYEPASETYTVKRCKTTRAL
jgi:hypothetical protein